MILSLAVLLCCRAPILPDVPKVGTVAAASSVPVLPGVPVTVDTVPIALVLADRLYIGWARASIVRPRGEGPDIIIVSRETTTADLAKAVAMLLESRVDAEPPLSNEMRAHVSPSDEEPERSHLLDVLADGLERLPRASPMYVPDYGMVPRLVIEVPVEPAPDDEGFGASPDSSGHPDAVVLLSGGPTRPGFLATTADPLE